MLNHTAAAVFFLLFACVALTRAARHHDVRAPKESPSSSSGAAAWSYKFAFTANINSQLSIDCSNDDQIWIGWSHYGTRSPVGAAASEAGAASLSKSSSSGKFGSESGILSASIKNSQVFNFPNENDCWMNFTEKIAEQCNGSPNCEISSQPTYIHKCNKISDYIYVAYKCIRAADTFDICKSETRVYSQELLQQQQSQAGFYIKSPDFPVEYPSSVDCSCSITANTAHPLKLEVLWFSLQDNDFISAFNRNLTGWINPTYEMPLLTRSTTIRFATDDALAYKGFWLKVAARRTCKDDWQLVGDSCVKIFSDTVDWRTANQRCQQMNGYLVRIDDVVSDLKLTQYMKSFYPEIGSYWIGLRKFADDNNQERWMWSSNITTPYEDVSWWPWRKPHAAATAAGTAGAGHHHSPNHCVIKRKNEDGYFATSCDSLNRNNFICQTETMFTSSERDLTNAQVKLQCGSTEEIRKAAAASTGEAMSSLEFPAPAEIGSTSIKLVEKKIGQDILKSAGIFGSLETISASFPSAEEDSKSTEDTATTTTARATTKLVRKTNGLNRGLSKSVSSSSSSSSAQPTKQYQLSSSSSNGAIAQVKNVEAAHSSASSASSGTKLNTTVLAGMITGVGFVVILINLGVLFICRRNLKNFIKSTKDTRNPREDIIQEYFDAFNTLHNLNGGGGAKTMRVAGSAALAGVPGMAGLPAHTLHSFQHGLIKENLLTLQQQQQLRSNSNSSGEELLLHDAAAQLFFSPQQAQQTFSREANVRQSVSAFKPFMKEHLQQQQQLLLINSQQNQYDKMSHQKITSGAASSEENNSAGQYAHTYESLDTLEVPNRRTLVHLGINGRNYRTVNDVLLQAGQQLSPSLNIENTTNITEVGNFNLSSTSTSSSSGSSSTHPFIRSSNNNSSSTCNLNANGNGGHLMEPHSQQLLIPQTALPAQIITLNDLKQFNHLILQHNSQQHLLIDAQNGTLNLNLKAASAAHQPQSADSWSPDSAYYSSIPTLATSYTPNFCGQSQMLMGGSNNSNFKSQQQQQQTQQPFLCNGQEQFKSHLV